jgi:mannose-6-phosphate isomerase
VLNPGPLRFTPIFRRFLWGGRRLKTLLNKPVGDEPDYAESWEIVDHEADQSIVACGPLQGATLAEVMARRAGPLLGRHAGLSRFPLLFKFLDANKTLSVQVHPDDAQAAKLQPPDLGKTEAWVVLHADPGSVMYAGLRPEVSPESFREALQSGCGDACLHRIAPREGDCIFIPAGTVHALGEGLVVAEIQQSSNVTFRLFDWNRTGSDGKPRPLHVEQGLAVTNFRLGPIEPQQTGETVDEGRTCLVSCDKFVMHRCEFSNSIRIGGDQRFHFVAVLQGSARLDRDPSGRPLNKGETVLLPSDGGPWTLETTERSVVLDICLP